MDNHQIRIFGQMLAANARVIGMQAENAHCAVLGETPKHAEQAFIDEAMLLEQLSRDPML